MIASFHRWKKAVLISCLVVTLILIYGQYGQAGAAEGSEAKVTSRGGYTHLQSKSQNKGAVKIIVRVRAPSIATQSLLKEKDRHEQRTETLRVQDQVITELEGRGHKPGRAHKYKYAPYIAMTVDSAALDTLLSSPDVVSVEEDIPVPPALDLSVPRIGATQLHSSNITGAGVAVAILDTGVDKTHPFLEGSVFSEACYSSDDSGSSSLCPGGVITSTVAEGSAMPYGGNCPARECDHGTHVAGIVAGRSGVSGSPGPGVAPEASIIAIQVFSRFDSIEDCGGKAPCIMSWSSDQMHGLELVQDLSMTFTIASVNMSLGGGTYSDYCNEEISGMKVAIDNLRAIGIATVIASGNNYACGGISFPACISSAISVGATTDSDGVESYSNNASFLSLLAPGSMILSSVPGDRYESWSGTSMATPHVAGAWALMKQEFPASTVDEILDAFSSTGRSVTLARQGCTPVTKQRINVEEAYNLMSNNARLVIAKTGVGSGTVTSDPSGIGCGDTCSLWLPRDTVVTLGAVADQGSEFGGWSGGGCSGTVSCTVNLSAGTPVTASFLKQVTIGTEITFTGFDFGTKKGKVLIGDAATKIAEGGWTDKAVTVTANKIPRGSPDIFTVTITSKSKGAVPIRFDDACIVKPPEIDSLSGNHGPANANIVINGKFFGTKKPKVYLEYADRNGQTKTKNCKVTSWSMDKTTGESELVFVVPKLPEGTVQGPHPLKVVNKVGTATNSFTVDPSP